MTNTPDFNEILRKSGSRATSGRTELLKILWEEQKPVTVGYLQKKLPSLNEVTLYRALLALTNSKVVREVDFRHGHTHYEINILRDHHHHIVCTGCGVVEDIPCSVALNIKKPTTFSTVNDHAMEFFGICNTCSITKSI